MLMRIKLSANVLLPAHRHPHKQTRWGLSTAQLVAANSLMRETPLAYLGSRRCAQQIPLALDFVAWLDLQGRSTERGWNKIKKPGYSVKPPGHEGMHFQDPFLRSQQRIRISLRSSPSVNRGSTQ